MEYGTHVLELLTEINETSSINVKSRRVCSLIRRLRRRKVHRLSLERCVTTADMHAEPNFPKMIKDVIWPPNEIVSRLKKKHAVVCEERKPKFKECASRTREDLSPVVLPYSRVINFGFDKPSGQSNVSIAACMIKRKSTGPSNEPWRTPILLY